MLQWNFRTIFGIRDCGSNTESEDLMFIAFNLSTYKFFPKVPPKALSHDLQDFGILLMPFRALPWVTWSSRRKQPGKIPLTDTCRPRWKRPGRARRGGGGTYLHGLRRSECTVNSENLKFCAFKVLKDQWIWKRSIRMYCYMKTSLIYLLDWKMLGDTYDQDHKF